MYKYSKLTQHLKQLIERGELKPHDKLPSLRDQVARSGLSLMTVLNAYQELEAQGLIYSVQKSGYFVAPFYQSRTQPKIPREITVTQQIEINSLVFQYLKSIQSPEIVPLGSPFPSHEYLNPPKLLQILSRLSRDQQMFEPQTALTANLALRKLIAQRYTLQGIPTLADEIVITSGCMDALNLTLQAFTQQGDYILLQQTVFYGAWQIAEKLGLNVVTLPDHPNGIDVAAFEQALQRYPIKVCWLMLNCHNPLGFTVSTEIKQQIGDLLEQYQVHLIEDDVYQELYYRGEKPLPMKAFDRQNWVLHCSSFSKILGANFRIGWVHAGQFADKIEHLQLMSTISANTLLQQALVEFISNHHYEKHLRMLRRQLEKNKKQFLSYLQQHLPKDCQIDYHPSGYFLWISLPERLDSMQIYRALLEEKVSISPSELFTLSSTYTKGLRVNCSFLWTEDLKNALQKLVKIIRI
ncbi:MULTISPECIES: PLP-dependent aminotransferase family protein [Glaesserella]|uniref:Transcriptional regulator n=1 Tax=Glaesserella australis TaxID=2094024 RepID=A0A328BVA1_9PAST|nr:MULTISPECIES: PLP-dependent aminotransferase family protein [Glaesserella]AUI65075.1 transcriptional regulator [Glaesserella sp. 15-184]RAL18103.1 transcriptional regulator [Glaesserella australis]